MTKVVQMSNVRSEDHDEAGDARWYKAAGLSSLTDDVLMEAILENIHSTPIGQVLRRIGELPEVRRGKVLSVRRRLDAGTYDLDDRLDVTLDRVIEDLTA